MPLALFTIIVWSSLAFLSSRVNALPSFFAVGVALTVGGLVGLIRAFLGQVGYAVQFNVLDAETLRDAQRNPERYSTLQVRVTGWSVYFTSLTKLEQDQYIARIAHGL